MSLPPATQPVSITATASPNNATDSDDPSQLPPGPSTTQNDDNRRRILMTFDKLSKYCDPGDPANIQFSIQYLDDSPQPSFYLTDIKNVNDAWPLQLIVVVTTPEGVVLDLHTCNDTCFNHYPDLYQLLHLAVVHSSTRSSTLNTGIRIFCPSDHQGPSVTSGGYLINLELRDKEDRLVGRTHFGKAIHIGSTGGLLPLLPQLPQLPPVERTVQDSLSGGNEHVDSTSDSDWTSPDTGLPRVPFAPSTQGTSSSPFHATSQAIASGSGAALIVPTPAPPIPSAQSHWQYPNYIGPSTILGTPAGRSSNQYRDGDPTGLDRFHIPQGPSSFSLSLSHPSTNVPVAVPAGSNAVPTVSAIQPNNGFNGHEQMVHILGTGFVHQQYCLDVGGVRVAATQLSSTLPAYPNSLIRPSWHSCLYIN